MVVAIDGRDRLFSRSIPSSWTSFSCLSNISLLLLSCIWVVLKFCQLTASRTLYHKNTRTASLSYESVHGAVYARGGGIHQGRNDSGMPLAFSCCVLAQRMEGMEFLGRRSFQIFAGQGIP